MEKKEKTIYVKVTFTIPVKVPDSEEYDEYFDIEENHCPGTGLVGIAIDEHIKEFNKKGMCWACSLNGRNEIVESPTDSSPVNE